MLRRSASPPRRERSRRSRWGWSYGRALVPYSLGCAQVGRFSEVRATREDWLLRSLVKLVIDDVNVSGTNGGGYGFRSTPWSLRAGVLKFSACCADNRCTELMA